MKKYILLTFDLEEFVRPIELSMDCRKSQLMEVSRAGLNKIISILKANSIHATFFTTYEFAKKCKRELKLLTKMGCEISLHAYSHKDDYRKISSDETFKRLREAKVGIEKIAGAKILGFRSPQMIKINRNILKKLNIKYDSSSHPTIAFDPTLILSHYSNIFGKRDIHNDNGITVIPVSVTPILRFPFSWIWFRNLGLSYTKACTKACLTDQHFINIYFHPWDFVNLRNTDYGKTIRPYKIERLYSRNSGEWMVQSLNSYIKWCKKSGLIFKTIKEYLHESRGLF